MLCFLWRSHVYFDPIKVYMKRVKLATIRIRTDQNEHSSSVALSVMMKLDHVNKPYSATFTVDHMAFLTIWSISVKSKSSCMCLRTFNRSFPLSFFFFFFFWLFLLRMRGNLLINRKMSISRLLWDDRWKLHGEIQCHTIVTTYMFITNDWCKDSFV